ncbi:slc25a42, partial [Symbiodinium pilosum]
MKAEGPQQAECEGAQFQNDGNVITIENDNGCGLTNYEYSAEYCPDQDHLVVNLVKPYQVRMVLDRQACPVAGE